MTAKLVLVAGCGLYVVLPAGEASSGAAADSSVSAGSPVSAASPAPARAGCPRLLHLGQTDPINGPDCIARLQTALRQVGYRDQQVTGYFGGQTEENVRKFQQRHHIDPTNGIAGPITRTVLRLATTDAPPDLTDCPPLHRPQKDPINGRYCITILQWALQHVSVRYRDQTINGRFLAETDKNVRDFQQRNRIPPPRGLVGPKTKDALLGRGTQPSVPPTGETQPSGDEFYYYYCGDGGCHLYLSRSATRRYARQLGGHPIADSVAKNLAVMFVCRVVRSLIFVCTGLDFVVDVVANVIANKLGKAAQQHACLHLSVGLSSTRPDWRLFNAEPDKSRRCSN
jgi:peptidoglycan hydrolase-like protein with peptidoglycan-binding domain